MPLLDDAPGVVSSISLCQEERLKERREASDKGSQKRLVAGP